MAVLLIIYIVGTIIATYISLRICIEDGEISLMDLLLIILISLTSWLFCVLYILKERLSDIILWRRT